jgi:hypothetical protein
MEKLILTLWSEIILAPIADLPAGAFHEIHSVLVLLKVYFGEVSTPYPLSQLAFSAGFG